MLVMIGLSLIDPVTIHVITLEPNTLAFSCMAVLVGVQL
jgi:hypothetical protein